MFLLVVWCKQCCCEHLCLCLSLYVDLFPLFMYIGGDTSRWYGSLVLNCSEKLPAVFSAVPVSMSLLMSKGPSSDTHQPWLSDSLAILVGVKRRPSKHPLMRLQPGACLPWDPACAGLCFSSRFVCLSVCLCVFYWILNPGPLFFFKVWAATAAATTRLSSGPLVCQESILLLSHIPR